MPVCREAVGQCEQVEHHERNRVCAPCENRRAVYELIEHGRVHDFVHASTCEDRSAQNECGKSVRTDGGENKGEQRWRQRWRRRRREQREQGDDVTTSKAQGCRETPASRIEIHVAKFLSAASRDCRSPCHSNFASF